MSLPTNKKGIRELFFREIRHPVMKIVYDAIKMKRCPNQVFILLVGLTGGGKSSTINYVFERDIAETCETESKTRYTEEFSINMKSDEYKDLQLSFIDTPGFNDTFG